jgi:hypothetical protein
MYFATKEDKDRFFQEQDRLALLRESYRAARIHLAARLGDAQRTLGAQIGQLSDEEKTALTATIVQCRSLLEELDRQHTYYANGQ